VTIGSTGKARAIIILKLLPTFDSLRFARYRHSFNMHETFSPSEEAGTTALLHSTVTVLHSWTSPMYFKYHRV